MEIPEVNALKQEQISDEQVDFFLKNGFLVVRNVLKGEELKQIKEDMMELVRRGSESADHPDYMYGKGLKSGKDILRRIEYVIDKKDSMKNLLGHPFILKSVEKLQGPNFIPTWDSMVLKMPDEGIIVPWHRDAEPLKDSDDPRPIFNVDFYLDPADIQTCLWVIPGSNHWSEEAAERRCQQEGFDTSDAVPVIMNEGDVIFHDITVLHGSPSGNGNALRRTVYFEFRPAEIEKAYGPHTTEYLPLKQQVLLNCIEHRKSASYIPEETPFTYSPDKEYAVKDMKSLSTYRYPHEDYWRRNF